MAELLATQDELAIVLREEIPAELDDFSLLVLEQASDAVREAAKQPDWTITTAPSTARRIALWVAKRTYQNPEHELATGIGPLSSRVTDQQAAGVTLTADEEEALAAFWPADAVGADAGQLWVQPIDAEPPVTDGLIYLATPEGTPLLYADTADPIATIAVTPDAV